MKRCLVVVVSLFSIGVTSTASAQPESKPPPRPDRDGWHIGFGIGGGQMSCEAQTDMAICNATLDEAGSLELHGGKMLNQRLSIGGEAWVMIHSEDLVTISHAITTVALQYWLFPRIWVKGGLGGASARARYKGPLGLTATDETDTVPGFMFGIGMEVVVGKAFTLDIQGKYGTGIYKDDQVRAHNAALAVGFNWY